MGELEMMAVMRHRTAARALLTTLLHAIVYTTYATTTTTGTGSGSGSAAAPPPPPCKQDSEGLCKLALHTTGPPPPIPPPPPPPLPQWYPGRPVGICTSRGHLCMEMIKNKPYHVMKPGRCEASRPKTLRDRFGRPLTIRYTYNRKTYVANREQVCNLGGHLMSSNRTRLAEQIDDNIWKNLSIWSKEYEHLWAQPAEKEAYIKCHSLFAGFHCSSMFPNCTAEFIDTKPALPCKELCEKTKKQCTFGKTYFLPYQLLCAKYPSKTDPYKKCTEVSVTNAYAERIAGVRSIHSPTSLVAIALSMWVVSQVTQSSD